MLRKASLCSLSLLLWASSSLPAQTRVERIKGAGLERSVDCAASPVVEVTGERNRVHLAGRCDKVKLSGIGHQVFAEGLGRVEMSGVDHRVEWQFSTSGSRPRVDDNGLGNTVVQAPRTASDEGASAESKASSAESRAVTGGRGSSSDTAPAAPARAAETRAPALAAGTIVSEGKSLEVNGTGIRRTIRCEGGSVQVNGTGNTLVARGECDRIEVNGMGNRVRVESARILAVHGINQQVAWVRGPGTDERPRISNEGLNNRVVRIELDELDERD